MTTHQRKFASCARQTKGVKSKQQRREILKRCLRK